MVVLGIHKHHLDLVVADALQSVHPAVKVDVHDVVMLSVVLAVVPQKDGRGIHGDNTVEDVCQDASCVATISAQFQDGPIAPEVLEKITEILLHLHRSGPIVILLAHQPNLCICLGEGLRVCVGAEKTVHKHAVVNVRVGHGCVEHDDVEFDNTAITTRGLFSSEAVLPWRQGREVDAKCCRGKRHISPKRCPVELDAVNQEGRICRTINNIT
mmetsp:Transcript_1763/g.6945  ORF Transcript_1763/g.6945 Transcript_1763/m.6945 type:complete len:213 (-) Transcript_1763:1496-2134(-)